MENSSMCNARWWEHGLNLITVTSNDQTFLGNARIHPQTPPQYGTKWDLKVIIFSKKKILHFLALFHAVGVT
eukprot:scaffold25409_cov37-Attheya_sp.AAC.2